MSRPVPEQEALAARRAQLTAELSRISAMTQGLEATRAREMQLAHELAAVDASLAAHRPARRPLPMLDQVKIASPCTMTWQDMVGDERVRFCGGCQKNVFNLSAMLAHEAEQLLAERLGNDLCVRFYQRADGTVMTQDCAVGVKKKQRKSLAMAVAGAGAMAAAALLYTNRQQATLGAIHDEAPDVARDVTTITVPPVMGEPALPSTAAPVPTDATAIPIGRLTPPPKHPVRMGKPVMQPPSGTRGPRGGSGNTL
ncbi:MAG: hypothetical protein JWP97_6456 [Labilithrix sp.]|nr:hypothetical protein [Labilithrix sp.]